MTQTTLLDVDQEGADGALLWEDGERSFHRRRHEAEDGSVRDCIAVVPLD